MMVPDGAKFGYQACLSLTLDSAYIWYRTVPVSCTGAIVRTNQDVPDTDGLEAPYSVSFR